MVSTTRPRVRTRVKQAPVPPGTGPFIFEDVLLAEILVPANPTPALSLPFLLPKRAKLLKGRERRGQSSLASPGRLLGARWTEDLVKPLNYRSGTALELDVSRHTFRRIEHPLERSQANLNLFS